MITQNETSAFILEQIPGSRLVKRPKKLGPNAEGIVRWTGRIADENGQVLTVRVLDTEPRTITTEPYLGYNQKKSAAAAASADSTEQADAD
jgi:hypothetical protein